MREHYLAVSTDPVDRLAAEKAIRDVYREGGFAPPERIVWAESPVAARQFLEPGAPGALLSEAGNALGAILWSNPIEAEMRVKYSVMDWGAAIMAGPGLLQSLEGPHIYIDGAVMVNACLGNMSAVRIATCLSGNMPPMSPMAAKLELTKHCGWFYPYEKLCVACDRPLIVRLDEIWRMHCTDGPALVLRCGHRQFAFNGVRVTEQIICSPETLSIDQIESEPNVEVRRVMIARFGTERFLVESRAEAMHSDDWGTLYRKEIARDEPLMMVKVINSTAEPDGTFREYFLRVPPRMRTSREAVAWTFGKKEADYAPQVET